MSIILNDGINIGDSRPQLGLRGKVIGGYNKRVEEYVNPYGKVSYRSKLGEVLFEEENIVPIGAYDWVFDKLFNISLDSESTLRTGFLNDEPPQMKIGVNPAEYKYQTQLTGGVNIPALNYIQGFMIGDGGAMEDNITARSTDYKRRSLFHAIPFRISTDGTASPSEQIEHTRYMGRFSNTVGVTSYYIKAFDAPSPHIVHSWVTDDPDQFEVVDDSVFTSTSSIPIESYIEIAFSISKYDTRGYYSSINATPRLNELGLVAGFWNSDKQDLETIRLLTHFTRSNIPLQGTDTLEILYRIYAR